MGILRLLFRTFARSRRPKIVLVERDTRVVAQQPRPRQPPRTEIHQTTHIRIVEVQELRGRAWVIDGDTIDIGGTRIRLAGIDAPEMDHPYGKNAKWALVNLCRGKEVRAVFDGNLSHDRTVATCYLSDGRDLSAEMVKAGMAIDWPKFSRGKYSDLELPGIRRKLWRCDARQRGRMPPSMPD
ncbi:thermonuclease family protein [Tabrizicola sp.]|uniref:thermonuclease family protein n=1 Tax=Tabrizicola sp. TaxID=2005166 RepID=UPI002FDD0D22